MSYIKQRAKQPTKLVAATLTVLAFLILSGWLGWPTTPVAAGKSLGTKVVDIDRLITLDPVIITKVTVAGQQIQPGEAGVREDNPGTPFQADEDWLKNMSVFLQNRTNKPIVCAQLRLWFPDTGDGTAARPVTHYDITVGQRPESSRYYSNGSKIPPDPREKPLLLAPHGTIIIPVADSIDAIQPTVEGVGNMLFSQITRVNIQRYTVYFEDGTHWVGHAYYSPDPDHPGKYIKLADNYFPGRPGQN